MAGIRRSISRVSAISASSTTSRCSRSTSIEDGRHVRPPYPPVCPGVSASVIAHWLRPRPARRAARARRAGVRSKERDRDRGVVLDAPSPTFDRAPAGAGSCRRRLGRGASGWGVVSWSRTVMSCLATSRRTRTRARHGPHSRYFISGGARACRPLGHRAGIAGARARGDRAADDFAVEPSRPRARGWRAHRARRSSRACSMRSTRTAGSPASTR